MVCRYFKIIMFFCFFMFSLVSKGETIQSYAHLTPTYLDNQCQIFFWVYEGSEKKKVKYKGFSKLHDDAVYCEVHIPLKDFNYYFEYCALSRVANSNEESGAFSIDFSGGEIEERDFYWFSWKDARYVHPGYFCKLSTSFIEKEEVKSK